MAMGFYLSADCPDCGEEMFYGLCITTLEHDGRPVIQYDIAAQTTFTCEECGTNSYTGDFDLLTEDQI